MKTSFSKRSITILAGLAFCTLASGYSFIFSGTNLPVKWTPDTTSVQVKILADNTTLLSDGSTRASCIQAAMTDSTRGWNRNLGDLQFAPQILPASQGADGNGVNEIFFSNNPYGRSWESHALAVTTVWLSDNQRVEGDIIVNTAYTWDSYRGASQGSGTSGSYDLQRVMLHELGHMLGLDHPDQASPVQYVSAIMNSIISNLDSLTSDDIAGAQKLYGASPYGSVPSNDNFASAVALTLSGGATSAQVTGTNVNATRETGEPAPDNTSGGTVNPGGRSVWWKWTAPSAGSVTIDLAGSLFDTTLGIYTGSSVAALTKIAYNDDRVNGTIQYSMITFNAVAGTTYYFLVDGFNSNDGKGADSAAIALNLNFAAVGGTAAAITNPPASEDVTPGGTVTFSVTATGSAPLSYQWSLNGVPVSNATSSTLTITNVQEANVGRYTVAVTNNGGTVTSSPAFLTLADALANQTVATGHSATISANRAVGTVQWQISTNSGVSWSNLSDSNTYGGTTTDTLTINATTAMTGYQYRYIDNLSGNIATSNAVTLAVTPDLLPSPACITLNSLGALIVGDSSTNTIQSINTSTGVVTLLAGANLSAGTTDGLGSVARFNQPGGIAYSTDGYLYVTDTANGTVRRIASDGTVSTLAGSTVNRGSADGTGSSATFNNPTGIAALGSNLYVADASNNMIRKVTTAGVVTTLAGTTTSGYQNGTASGASFNHPSGTALDGSGNVYVTDSTNNIIRKITPAGVVTTLAGTPGMSGYQNGTGATATFNNPTGIAIDRATGDLYIADTGNSNIRKVTTPDGVVSLVAGLPTVAGLEDNIGYYALFNQPRSLVLDATATNLYVADTGNAAIRKIALSTRTVTTVALAASSNNSSSSSGSSGSSGSGVTTSSSSSGGGGGGAVSPWYIAALAFSVGIRFLKTRTDRSP